MSRRRKQNLSPEEIIKLLENSSDDDDDDFDEVEATLSANNNDVDNFNELSANIDDIEPDIREESDSDICEETVANIEPTRRRFQRPNKPVHSMETALDEANYNEFRLPSEETIVTSVLQKASGDSLERTLTWTTKQPEQRQSGAHNVIRNRPGVRQEYASLHTQRDIWELFYSREMVAEILERTNQKIQLIRHETPSGVYENVAYFMHNVDEAELYALIGVCYARGLLGQNLHSTDVLFDDSTGHNVFAATFGKRRFKFLLSVISFDDPFTRPQRYKYDKFAAMRHVFELFNENCSRVLVPDIYIAVDESLIASRNRTNLKQYNPMV